MNLKHFAPLALSVALFVPGLAQAAPPAAPSAHRAPATHSAQARTASLEGKVQSLNRTSMTLEVGKAKKVLTLDKKVAYHPSQASVKPGARVKVETNTAGAITSVQVL